MYQDNCIKKLKTQNIHTRICIMIFDSTWLSLLLFLSLSKIEVDNMLFIVYLWMFELYLMETRNVHITLFKYSNIWKFVNKIIRIFKTCDCCVEIKAYRDSIDYNISSTTLIVCGAHNRNNSCSVALNLKALRQSFPLNRSRFADCQCSH